MHAPQKQRRAPWLRLLQIAGTLGLSVFLAFSIDWQQFWDILVGLRWNFVALAAGLLLMAHTANLIRWYGLIPQRAITPGLLTAYYGAGLFSNNFLPSGVGGDGIRVILVGRHVPIAQGFISVALDRGIGLAGLCFFALPGLWLGVPTRVLDTLRPTLAAFPSLWIAVALAVIGAGGLAAGVIYRRSARLQGIWAKLHQGMIDIKSAHPNWIRLLLSTFALSVWSNLGTIGAHWAILLALHISVAPSAAIWVVILGSLSLMAPISVNGLGVLESIFVVVLAAYGVPAPAALATALLARALGIIYSLLGGLLSLRISGELPQRAQRS